MVTSLEAEFIKLIVLVIFAIFKDNICVEFLSILEFKTIFI